jgi:hypothetical protein
MVRRRLGLARVQVFERSLVVPSIADVAESREGLAAQPAAMRRPLWMICLRLSIWVPPRGAAMAGAFNQFTGLNWQVARSALVRA